MNNDGRLCVRSTRAFLPGFCLNKEQHKLSIELITQNAELSIILFEVRIHRKSFWKGKNETTAAATFVTIWPGSKEQCQRILSAGEL